MHAVDVLLPYYGDVELMKEAVRSVVGQSNPDWRLTVIDDRYPDEEPARWFANLADTRVTYLRNETNLGANANYRRSLSLAEAPVVVMMGGDDIMLPQYLEQILNTLGEFPQAAAVQPGVRVIDGAGRLTHSLTDRVKTLTAPRSEQPLVLRGQDMAVSLLHAPWHYFPSIAWRRDVIARIGFRPEFNVVQDLALLIDIAAEDGSIVITPEVVFHYRRHKASDSAVRALDGSRFREERSYFRSQASRFADCHWDRAAFAARVHWTSRLNAATVLLASLAHPRALLTRSRLHSSAALLRHVLS
ncbi:glycosyltransferase [Arthrobacter sp. zg-Y40]|uniref:glycosyltransferase family 2 protein n=1 Tax=Arthrobacter sp. zg-Y40 TaxID=2886939 RepID=UPI001D14A2CA|nr:glycosyltransferase [Arthrobacter sp. zg-Y40]MCC3277707.1 glycosyltransferase [Arthrobacter sp. zg-Y40]